MEAEPTPTRDMPARAPLAASPGRLRGLVQGVLRRPMARRALVVGGLAVAGWLIGAGNGAFAADTPAPAVQAAGPTTTTPTTSNPVRGQVDQTTGLVHTGSDAVGRTAGSLDRARLAARGDRGGAVPETSNPVRGQVDQTTGLVHTGSDAVGRTAESLDHVRLRGGTAATTPSVRDRVGQAGALVRDGGKALAAGPARLLGAAGTRQRPADMGKIAAPVTSLLNSGTVKVKQALPVRGALDDPSSVVAPVTHGMRHATPVVATQAAPAAATHAARTPEKAAGHAATPGGAAPRLTRPFTTRVFCSALACGHAVRGHQQTPDVPAPVGPRADDHGALPSPATGGGQTMPGTGDVAWTSVDRTPPHLAIVAPRRGVLPPVVRTAADEPSLSPD